MNRKYSFLPDSWNPYTLEKRTVKDPCQGKMDVLAFVSGGSRWNIHLHLTFALPENEPSLLWKMKVGNFGEEPIFIEQFDLFWIPIVRVNWAAYPKLKSIDLPSFPMAGKVGITLPLMGLRKSNGDRGWVFSKMHKM